MSIRGIARRATAVGYATPTNAPIYVDSDDNRLKYIPAGSGSTEIVLQESNGAAAFEIVTTTNVLTAAESGKTFFLALATGFLTTLPAVALGLNFKFIVQIAPSSGTYTIDPVEGTDIIFGAAPNAAGTAGDATSGTGVDLITFADGQAQIGDWVEVSSNGVSWFARVCMNSATAITFD